MEDIDLDVITRQIARYVVLDDEDRAALLQLPFQRRSLSPKTYLTREGSPPDHHLVLATGFTQRTRRALSGEKQIISIQMPGEALSCSTLFFDVADHSTQALTAVEILAIPRDVFRATMLSRPAISEAILKMTLIEASISSEWLLNIGKRPAKVRTAHLL